MTHDHADIKAHILARKPRWGYCYKPSNKTEVRAAKRQASTYMAPVGQKNSYYDRMMKRLERCEAMGNPLKIEEPSKYEGDLLKEALARRGVNVRTWHMYGNLYVEKQEE